jgi:hypothetical protein
MRVNCICGEYFTYFTKIETCSHLRTAASQLLPNLQQIITDEVSRMATSDADVNDDVEMASSTRHFQVV